MAEGELIKLALQYGPVVMIVWFAYRDWEREKRMAKALDEGTRAMHEIAVKATTAIAENTMTLMQMREEMAAAREWDGKNRRHT